jgi:hypothetical protein
MMAAAVAASLYRCADCGHGQQLTAWANATVHGPLGADGEITTVDWDEQWHLFEDSIQCDGHPVIMVLEKHVGGQWCRWRSCPRCSGAGVIAAPPGERYTPRCPEDGFRPAGSEPRDPLAHRGWWPASQPVPASTVNKHGHVFTPRGTGECRYCRTVTSAVNAGKPCRGDAHQCPVIVAAGDSDTARQHYRRDDWVCSQPGAMNEDFTEWRCGRGHVITRAGHVTAGQRHDHLQCPWEFLADDRGRRP